MFYINDPNLIRGAQVKGAVRVDLIFDTNRPRRSVRESGYLPPPPLAFITTTTINTTNLGTTPLP